MTLTANANGEVQGKFTIPANVPSGSKEVAAVGAGGSRATAVFTGIGTVDVELLGTVVNLFGMFGPGVDPLAQTFTPQVNMQVTGVQLWFATKTTTPGRVQIRAVTAGFPDRLILADRAFLPSDLAATGQATEFVFASPLHLIGGVEYAIVVLCDDSDGELAIAGLGQFDEINQRWITAQPYMVGVLLSSSNAVTWTAHQDRDMAFRLLGAAYTETTKVVPLGEIEVEDATDFIVQGLTETPASPTAAEFVLTLPDATEITATDGQIITLSEAVTGTVELAARLRGSELFSPVLFPGARVIAGTIASAGTYVSRAVPAGVDVTAKVVFDGFFPSGSSVAVHYKGPDGGDTWQTMDLDSSTPSDDGFHEFTYTAEEITETTIQVRLSMAGSAAARPRIRDLRVVVI